MSITELFTHITDRGGNSHAIYTGTGNPEERYAIIQDQNAWHVFYSERGQKLEQARFLAEEKACEYLLKLLKKDETFWRMLKT